MYMIYIYLPIYIINVWSSCSTLLQYHILHNHFAFTKHYWFLQHSIYKFWNVYIVFQFKTWLSYCLQMRVYMCMCVHVCVCLRECEAHARHTLAKKARMTIKVKWSHLGPKKSLDHGRGGEKSKAVAISLTIVIKYQRKCHNATTVEERPTKRQNIRKRREKKH